MRVPSVDSVIKVRVRYNQGPRMIPPQPGHTIYEGKVLTPYKWLTDRQFCLSGDDNWAIRVISMDHVESLDILSGSTRQIDTEVKTWEVAGSKGNKYLVTRNKNGWSCTCPGATFRKSCKHITQLMG